MFFNMAQQPPVSQGLLIIEIHDRTQLDTPQNR